MTVLDIPLTGERSYIHGADIFDALTAATGALHAIRLVLKTAGNCTLELHQEATAPAGIEPCGRFRHTRAGSTYRYILLRGPDRPVPVRMPMPMPMPGDARLDGDPSATFMQRLTADAVALLERDFPDDYWSIAEIACLHLSRSDASAAAAIIASVGNRFWKIAALADGAAVGHVVMARGLPRR